MYEDMIKDVKDKMQPVMEVAEINKKAAEKLFALQSAYVSDFLNGCFSQMQAMATVKEPKQLVEMQMDYYKQLEAKLTDVAEKEIAAMTEAKEQLTEVVEKSIADMNVITEVPYFNDFSKYMDNMTGNVVAEQPASTEAAPAKKAPARPARKSANADAA